LVISWIAAAVGLVSVFKVFVSFFPTHLSPYLQVAVGVLTALLCGPLVRAGRKVEDILKTDGAHIAAIPEGISDSSAKRPEEHQP
jgi:hypothetical protein